MAKTKKLRGGLGRVREFDGSNGDGDDHNDPVENIRRNHRKRQQERDEQETVVEVAPVPSEPEPVAADAPVAEAVATAAPVQETPISRRHQSRLDRLARIKKRASILAWAIILLTVAALIGLWVTGVVEAYVAALSLAVLVFLGGLFAKILYNVIYGVARINGTLRVVTGMAVISPLWLAHGSYWAWAVTATLSLLLVDAIVRWVTYGSGE